LAGSISFEFVSYSIALDVLDPVFLAITGFLFLHLLETFLARLLALVLVATDDSLAVSLRSSTCPGLALDFPVVDDLGCGWRGALMFLLKLRRQFGDWDVFHFVPR